MEESNFNEQQSKLPSEAEIGSSFDDKIQEIDPSPEQNEATSTVPDTDDNAVSSTSNEEQVDGKNLETDDKSLEEKSALSSHGMTPKFISSVKHIIYLLL